MTRTIISRATTLLLLATLAACGADGAPKPPAAKTGLTITGQAEIGISGGA